VDKEDLTDTSDFDQALLPLAMLFYKLAKFNIRSLLVLGYPASKAVKANTAITETLFIAKSMRRLAFCDHPADLARRSPGLVDRLAIPTGFKRTYPASSHGKKSRKDNGTCISEESEQKMVSFFILRYFSALEWCLQERPEAYLSQDDSPISSW
jgi:hypothetical protein